MFHSLDEDYLDQLLVDINIIDQYRVKSEDEESSVTTKDPLTSNNSFLSSPSSDSSVEIPSKNADLSLLPASSHTIVIQKRRYRKRRKQSKGIKNQNHRVENAVTTINDGGRMKKYSPIILHRLVKHDIRRKYPEMYANVMNSHNFKLMTTFFKKFFLPNSNMLKLPSETTASSFPSPSSFPVTEIAGVDFLIYYFLILAQSTPDRITQVSNIQIRQRSDTEDVIITCMVKISCTQIYDVQTCTIIQKVIEDYLHQPIVMSGNMVIAAAAAAASSSSSSSSRKRKIDNSESIHSELHESLFDPVGGVFCQTRFSKLEAPKVGSWESTMTLRVNGDKRIAGISFIY